MKQLFVMGILFSTLLRADMQQEVFHGAFREDFSEKNPVFFRYGSAGTKAGFKWTSGKRSRDEKGSKILSLKLDPKEEAGAGKGPEIISKRLTHFGTYSARLKIPDVTANQPDVGAVVGYFTYHMDEEEGLSEIDFEWLLADPRIIYIGTWTGEHGELKRVGRTINMATGEIHSSEYRKEDEDIREPLVGVQNQPETIHPISGYDASSRFYTYGFDWYSNRIRWWMLDPVTADTVVLWDYQGKNVGIPQHPSKYRMNFWHTDNWPVETNPNSIEKPRGRYEVQVDWMGYTPFTGK